MKKTITKEVGVEITIPYYKKFKVTKEVNFDEESLKDYGNEDEYFDAEFAEEFEEEAKEMMDKHLNSDFREHDLDWDNMEYTDVEIDEQTVLGFYS